MKNSKTPKIVVAAGLVAVYASGMAYLALGDKPAAAVVHNAPVTAPDAQMAAEQAPPSSIAEAVTDASAGLAEQPTAATNAADPAPIVAATTPRNEQLAAREVAKPAASDEAAVASHDAARVSDEAVPAEQVASAASGNDSQITDDVKTQIAAVVPAATIDVTTRDGVVELAGSVPSQDQIEKVWLAARNVPAVRGVDVSALMISN